MELKRHSKNGKKYNINKDFKAGERRLYRHPWEVKMENSDVSSDVSVSLRELSIEVYKYLYINRKVFLIRMARYKYATTGLAIYIRA